MNKKIIAILLLGVIASLWLFYPNVSRWVVSTNASDRIVEHSDASWALTGQHGDTYGGLTSLFTMLAFWGLLIGIWLQQSQLEEQRLFSAAGRTPFVDWNAPVIHFIGRGKDSDGSYVGAVIRAEVACIGDSLMMNPVLGCEIKDKKGRVLAKAACDFRGGTVAKKNLIMFAYLRMDCNKTAGSILDAIVSRSELELVVNLYFMNTSGETFAKHRIYGLDCPSSDCRFCIEKIQERVVHEGEFTNDEAKMWKSYIMGLEDQVYHDKNSFVLPFVSSIAKIMEMKSGPISLGNYRESVNKLASVSRRNRFDQLVSCKESFALKTSKELVDA